MASDPRTMAMVQCLIGLLLIGLSIPLMLRRVPMNSVYGVRIPAAFKSEANWYAINAYGGRVLAWTGVVIIVLGLVVRMRPPTSSFAITAVSFAPVVIVLLTFWPILRFARRLPSAGRPGA